MTYAKENVSSLNIRETLSIPVTQYIKLKNVSKRNWIQNPWKVVGVRSLGKMFGQLEWCKTVSGGKELSVTLEQIRRLHIFVCSNTTEDDQLLMKCLSWLRGGNSDWQNPNTYTKYCVLHLLPKTVLSLYRAERIVRQKVALSRTERNSQNGQRKRKCGVL